MSTRTERPRILVTGATGRHGGTGAHLVRRLREAGRPVRVLVRRLDDRVAEMERLGAEIAVGDLHDRASLVGAFTGVGEAYFTYPIAPGVVQAAASFASAACAAGTVERVIVMSMAVASPTSPSHLGRAQWLAEEVLCWSGLRCTILRVAALFYENLLTLHGDDVRAGSAVRNSFGAAAVPWIAGEDAAELAVAAILHPERFAGADVHYPPGAALHTHAEIAAVLGEELGREVVYEAVDAETWAADLTARAVADRCGVINADGARHIAAIGAALARPGQRPVRAPNAAELARLIGRPPLGLREFVRAAFSNELLAAGEGTPA
jgi:uncharacterized protein YbjT (DUF2867 family)